MVSENKIMQHIKNCYNNSFMECILNSWLHIHYSTIPVMAVCNSVIHVCTRETPLDVKLEARTTAAHAK
jgi:hypothetical protein